ncbi:kinesin-like protein 98A isoform X2 [Lycorma delicatula]|uniref:kinesin-like protein 98A isoform X2 n=1 Tax=Lycorma delicatula TaxID=130591 RepID=UPI003F5122B0
MASVKVAVRVRPFNQREIDMGAKLIIQMEGKKTRITCSNKGTDRPSDHRYFTFDHSYWSFNREDPHYVSQEQVFNDLGTEVVNAAFEGYNACVFAYGQTGSGKTFTMMGSKDNQGLIPRICESLFKRMAHGANYRIEVSYLEIYNEKVKDLLRKDSGHNLKVRQHPTKGPCVMDLSRHLVSEYAHIQELMIRGNNQRTTASTNMNDVSSRSHAIFTLMFVQAQGGFTNDVPSETVSKVHLVDLAGSERANATGATGQRLKEGAHINKSLVTLGSVISALAELCSNNEGNGAQSTRKNVFIPYRDSVLTWLLKDSLGGNSKTIMIAAVSPADCNYTESLSTLRYANRAKNIINKPTINEDENVKLIRDLREEITKLKAKLATEYTNEVQPQVLAVLQEKEAQEKVLRQEWTDKWRETQKILQEQKALGLRKAGAGVVLDSDMPHLIGIDDDLLSTGVTLYHLKDGETLIGNDEADIKQDIVLNGLNVEKQHCSIVLNKGIATLIPKQNAQCWVNGLLVNKPTRLSQGCNILLGRTNMFRYNDPIEVEKLRKEGSHSLMNLSRLSLMSWSTPDLARFTENNSQRTSEEDNSFVEQRNKNLQDIPMEIKEDTDNDTQNDVLEMAEVGSVKLYKEEEEHCKMQRSKLSSDWIHLQQSQTEYMSVLKKQEQELKERIDTLQNERNVQIALVVEERNLLTKLHDSFRKECDLALKKMEEMDESTSSEHFSESCKKLNSDENLEIVKRMLQQCSAENLEKITQKKQNLNLSLSPIRPLATSSPKMNESYLPPSLLPSPSTSEVKTDDGESDVSSVDDSYKQGYLGQNAKILHQRSLQLRPRCIFSDNESGRNLNVHKMKQLMQQITRQRMLIMRCLETDIDSNQINKHISVLQEMKRDYVQLEQSLQEGCKENFSVSSVVNQDDSDDLSTSAEEMVSESTYEEDLKYQNKQCLNCSVLSKSTQDIRYRILQDRLQMSLATPLSISNQQINQACNYNRARSMPSLNRISAWDISRAEDNELSISVPGFLLRGAGRNTHFVYEVRIHVESEIYTILRRYRRFRELHLTMKHKYKDPVAKLSFPPRRIFPWHTDAEWVAKERRPQLELYLQRLLKTCSEIESCPLYNCTTKAALHQFSPFFKRGMFETGKFGTA